jgi:hypothetical protein
MPYLYDLYPAHKDCAFYLRTVSRFPQKLIIDIWDPIIDDRRIVFDMYHIQLGKLKVSKITLKYVKLSKSNMLSLVKALVGMVFYVIDLITYFTVAETVRESY